MPIDPKLTYESPQSLSLDPRNPRLGRENTAKNLSQEQLLKLMEDWTLEELAVSFLENGFWPQEALIVVREKIAGEKCLVVVEGNRRLAALLNLFKAKEGEPATKRWKEIAASAKPGAFDRLSSVPFVEADDRSDVAAYLGFRHVTGIKEWAPAEKAEFIATMIEKEKLTYEEVRRRIGSKTPTVRQNYISYRLLLQMEDLTDAISLSNVEERFSVLYLSLRTAGTQRFLQIDLQAEPKAAKNPVPPEKFDNLKDFALWLFGTKEREPIVKDSRAVDRFGEILESDEAVDYLRRNRTPNFEAAYRVAGGGESDISRLIEQAADCVEEALGTVHHHTKSPKVTKGVKRLGVDTKVLLGHFPNVRAEIDKEAGQ